MSHDSSDDARKVALRVALATLEGQYEIRGHKVNVHVSPCSWMYPGYGFQIGFKMQTGAAWGYVVDRKLTVETATKADVQRMLDSEVVVGDCTRCSVPFVKEPKSNRGNLCESCWTDDWKKKVDGLEKKAKHNLERQDARMLKKGYTHRVTAWVHAGGDDKTVDFYCIGRPVKGEIESHLRKMGSRVLDDYQVIPLNK